MKSSTVLSLIALLGSSAAMAVPATDSQWVEVVPAELSPGRLQELDAAQINSTELVARQGSCTFQAFTGGACGQPAGNIITNPSRCVDTRNRHSFFVSSGCGSGLRVSIEQNTGCPNGNNGGVFSPGCYNVNTGGNWQSSFVTGP